jgi:hypothetical protein
MCEYDPSQDVSRAPPAPKPNGAAPATPTGVTVLVKQNPPAAQCMTEKAALAAASGALLRSAGAMAVSAPTLLGELPAILGFIGSAIAVGATAAQLANCQEEAAAAARAGAK